MRRWLIIWSLLFVVISCTQQNSDNQGEKQLQNMSDSLPDGKYTEHYPSGEMKMQGLMLNDRRNGLWRSYNEQGKVTKAEYYYKGEIVTSVDASDFELQYVIANGKDFSIKLPASWATKKDFKEAIILAVKPLPDNQVFSPTISIVRTEIPQDISFNQFLALNIKDLQTAYQEFKVKEEKHDTIADKQVYEIMYFVRAGEQKLGVLSAYFNLENESYIITCIAEGKGEEFVKYKDLFREIIRTSSFSRENYPS